MQGWAQALAPLEGSVASTGGLDSPCAIGRNSIGRAVAARRAGRVVAHVDSWRGAARLRVVAGGAKRVPSALTAAEVSI